MIIPLLTGGIKDQQVKGESDGPGAEKTTYVSCTGAHERLVIVLPSSRRHFATPISFRSMQKVINRPVMTWTFLFPYSSSVPEQRMKSCFSAGVPASRSDRMPVNGFFGFFYDFRLLISCGKTVNCR
jgi:hypothetical protein